MAELTMPSLGADMEAGTLVEWLVHPGSPVKRGDVVAVVETDKGAIDLEIWQSGVIDTLAVEAGRTVPVGTVLATVREAGEATSTAAPVAPVSASPAASVASGRVRASPAARQLARERGVDLAAIHGSGPSGAVTRGDVDRILAAAPAPAPALPSKPILQPTPTLPPPPVPASGMRQAIAAAMTRAHREIPHYYVGTHVDVSTLQAWLTRENLGRSVEARLLPIVPLIKAIARALVQFPELNGTYVDEQFHPAEAVHLGIAVSLRGGGLVAPAIHDCDKKAIADLQVAMADLLRRARAGGLRSSELTNATVTVTSLGERGVETVYGIIYPPQVALVGLGAICERPWAVDGLLGVRPVLHITLTADHRVSDGHRGALFLAAVAALLQEPEKL